MLVDDNQINQLVAQGILEDLGLLVEVAMDGKEAIDALRSGLDSQPFDLVFMDCRMPVMDGYEASGLIREGKAGESNSAIPIIAMTANTMKGDREKCIAAGMDDYLGKPIEPDEIEEKLKIWLNK